MARPPQGEPLERGQNRERRPCDEDSDNGAAAGLLAVQGERQQTGCPCERAGVERPLASKAFRTFSRLSVLRVMLLSVRPLDRSRWGACVYCLAIASRMKSSGLIMWSCESVPASNSTHVIVPVKPLSRFGYSSVT